MTLTQERIDERKAILRRFRELLEAQRNKFREYLDVLEKHGGTIEREDADAILAHTELEQNIVGSIVTLQKVIVPIDAMYQEIVPRSGTANDLSDDSEITASAITALRADLENLQKQVLDRNEKNRELLKTHLLQIRQKLDSFRNPYANMKSVYASSGEHTASLVQIDV
jgi:hypothetical protein